MTALPPSRPVVIIGAGPAGSRAALRLVAAGLRPIVVDEQPRSGGQIYRRVTVGLGTSYPEAYGSEHRKALSLHQDFDAAVVAGQIDHRAETTAWAIHDGYLFVDRNGRTDRIDYDKMLIATGAVERILPVPGWNMPGVFTLGGAQIALKAQGCSVGDPVCFVGTGPLLYLVALQYARAGARIAGVFDSAPFSRRVRAAPRMAARSALLAKGAMMIAALRLRHGVRCVAGVRARAITGAGAVEALEIEHRSGRRETVACHAVAMGYDLRPEMPLADLAGCAMAYDEGARNWQPKLLQGGRSSVATIYVAGDAGGILGADAAEISGRQAAEAMLEDMGHAVSVPDQRGTAMLENLRRFRRGIEAAFPPPVGDLADLEDDAMLCRCEGVTAGEFRKAIAEMDIREINRAKSLTRCGMGRCQGRYCEFAAGEILAGHLRTGRGQVGRLRAQAPVKPLSSRWTEDEEAGK